VNELLAKLHKQIDDVNAAQAAALAAAEAEGVSAEDKAKHLAEFDRLQGDKDKARESLTRAQKLAADQAEAAAPARPPIITGGITPASFDPLAAVSFDRVTVPARARRHGALVAFKDRERDAYAAGVWCAAMIASGHQADFEVAQFYKQKAREIGLGFVSGGSPQAALTGLSNQSGGYFVPEVIDTRIHELSLEYGVLRRLAEIVPMNSDTKTTPRWAGAMVAYWIGRGSAPTSSDPSWNAVQLVARDMGAMTKIAKQLDEDSLIDLGEKVTVNVARAFALKEDDAGFNGDGSDTYGGVNGLLTRVVESGNSSCLITATGETTVGALTNTSFLSVTGAAPNYKGANWAWLCHKKVWAQSIARLQLAGGGNNVDSIASGGRPQHLGSPVEFVNVMPSAPTSGQVAVLYADLSMAVKVGDRRGRTVQAGYENDDFTKQLVTLLGTQRVDVNVHTVKDPLGDANGVGGPVMALKLG